MKDGYRTQKHTVQSVERNEIVMVEKEISTFTLKLKISRERTCMEKFNDEMNYHLENLNGSTDDDIDISCLIDDEHRATLVRGIAGMGKSVLAKRIAYEWANGTMYSEQFKLCIMFECRELNFFIETNGIEPNPDEVVSQFLKKKFDCDLGNEQGILFIVDGLDELKSIETADSVILQLQGYNASKLIFLGRPNVVINPQIHVSIGDFRKLEIVGLTNDQVKNSLSECSLKTADFLREHHLIFRVPQFFNTYLCVKGMIHSITDLYCWVICLLANEHECKRNSSKKQAFEIFKEYAEMLLRHSKVCHKLLKVDKIFLSDTELLRGQNSSSLFGTESANGKENYQFQQLSLMEFLSALYICHSHKLDKIIRKHVDGDRIKVLSFVLDLIAHSPEGIISDMLNGIGIVPGDNAKAFLLTVLKNLGKPNKVRKFEKSIHVIASILKADLTDKEILLGFISDCHLSGFCFKEDNRRNLMEICRHLETNCNSSDNEIRKAFENIVVEEFVATDADHLGCARYFNISTIKLQGIKIESDSVLKLEMAFRSGRKVHVTDCEINDEEKGRQKAENRESLNELIIRQCKLTHQSFITICGWGVSTVKFELRKLNIEAGWWRDLAETVTSQKRCKNLQLERLVIKDCETGMSEELKKMVRNLITDLSLVFISL